MDVRPGATPEILDEGGDLILQIVPGMSGVLGETGLPDTITPQWSPDGKFVYFLKRSEGTTKIWRAATDRRDRSEEHTSELQSLMRISYAVFCFKKKQKSRHSF